MKKTIYVKLTNNCQLQCMHCYNAFMNNNSDMPRHVLTAVFDEIIDQAQQNPQIDYDCQLHGGEPLQYKDIDFVIQQLQRTKDFANIHWCITTNLVYKLTDQVYELFQFMTPFDRNQQFIQTSWDYKIRFANDSQLQLWTNNVKTLLSKQIQVQPTVCLTNQLINEITGKQLIDYFLELGINHLNFERITNTGRAVQNHLRPNNKDLDQWLLDAFKYYETVADKITIQLFVGVFASLQRNFLGCRARHCMETVTTYNPDGSIGGCPNTAFKPFRNVNGSYNEKVYTIWIKTENKRDLTCLTCDYYQYCNGDCFQLQFDDTGCPGMKAVYEYLLNK